MNPRLFRLTLFASVAVAGGGCDLITKGWAESNLAPYGEPMKTSLSWLDFTLAYNQGTAFSFFSDLGTMRAVLGALSLLAVVGMAYYAWSQDVLKRMDLVGLGMIAGGAIGNGWDRLFRIAPNGGTGVVDFISMQLPFYGRWPTFNIADVLIAVGVGLFLIAQIKAGRAAAKEEAASTSEG